MFSNLFSMMKNKLKSIEVSYTQDLLSDNSNHNLNTQKCGFCKGEFIGFFSHSLEMEYDYKNTLETLILKGYL